MAIDPNIYAQVGQGVTQPVNMLTQTGDTARTANLLLNAQALAARGAAGRAFQASINPDGTTNQNLLLQNLAADPNAAMAAQESAQAGQTLSQQEYQQHMARLSYGAAGAAQLLAQYPNGVPAAAFKQYYDRAVQDGHVTAQDEAQIMQGIGDNPIANTQTILQRIGQNVGSQQALTNAVGAPGSMSNGQQVQPGMVAGITSPNAGAFMPAGQATKMLLSPDQLASSSQIGTTQQGAPIMGTTGQRLGILNVGQDGQPLAPPLGTGRLPPALLNPNRQPAPVPGSIGAGSPGYAPAAPAAPAAPGQAAVAPPTSPGIVTGVGPAQTAALSAQGASSNAAFQTISDQGVQARSHGAIIGNMLGDTQGFTSGQPALNAWKASLLKYAPETAGKLGVTPEQVASQESFDKWANQLATQQGAGTDARLEVSQHANPNSGMSQAGVDIVLRQLAGNADYQQARAKLAAGYGDQTDSRGFEAKVGSQLDPRAFQFDRMTTAQRQAYVNTLSPTDRASVQRSYNFAHQNRLLAAQAGTSGY